MFENLDSATKNRVVGLLINGNMSSLKAVTLKNKNYSVLNTCAFDCLTEIMLCAYADSTQYSTLIDRVAFENTEDNQLFFQLIRNAVRDGVTVQTYRKRAVILTGMNAFPERNVGHCIDINAAGTVVFLVEKLFHNHPSYEDTKICDKCSTQSTRAYLTATANLPTNDLNFLQDVIISVLEDPTQCRKCKEVVTRVIEVHEHIFMELIPPDYDGNFLIPDVVVILKDIPKELSIKNWKLTLRGAVHYLAPQNKTIHAIGHYIAYCWRSEIDRWQVFDDLHAESRFVRNTAKLSITMVIYTVQN